MPFDGLFLHKMIQELKRVETGRINKINQISTYDFIFNIRKNGRAENILISLHPEYSRIQFSKMDFDTPYEPTNLTMFLRKHLDGAIIRNIYQVSSDRVIVFELIATNELGDKVIKKLIGVIMGRRSNLIVTENNIILEAYRHISPFDGGNTVIKGAVYKEDDGDKLNPYSLNIDELIKIEENNSLFMYPKIFNGISKALIGYLENSSSLHEIINSFNPTLMKDKNDYYFTNLGGIDTISFESLSDMLDYFYSSLDKESRLKQKSNDIIDFITKQIDKNQNKLEKLERDLDNANNSDELRIKGELLLSIPYAKEKRSSIKIFNYYTNQNEEIKLNPLLSIIENANAFFNKYQKMKKSISHIEEQISITKDEIKYFDLLITQCHNASLNDFLEIKDELEENGYIKRNNKSKKKSKNINYDKYIIDNSIIYVGKNNLQNAYLSHKLAKPNDLWFHVKDAPGSHVILEGEVSEKSIRAAANLASYFSKYQNSSSVAVDYTKVRYLKKIPGRHACFVSYTNQKTIYIDPDLSLINKLKKSK